MTLGPIYSKGGNNNEPHIKLKTTSKMQVVSYILELPRLLLASVSTCIVFAAAFSIQMRHYSLMHGHGGGFRSFWDMAILFIVAGHIFTAPLLLLVYLPIALKLKKYSKRDWSLPLLGIIVAVLNGVVLSILLPLAPLIIPSSVIAGLCTGMYHELFIKLSHKFYFKKWLNP